MRVATTITLSVLRFLGVVQLALGLLFWAGTARDLVSLHQTNGFLIVAALWVLAILALRAGAARGLAVFALLWGIVLPVFGYAQTDILVGSAHWVIEVLHLLVGIAALAQGERLAAAIREKVPAVPAVEG